MLNCDKAILVAYIDIFNISKEKGIQKFYQLKNYIEGKFYNEKEINDDSLIILVLPSNKTEIQLLNAKYPEYEKILEESKKIYEELKNKPEDE
jgi:hypothetical protein